MHVYTCWVQIPEMLSKYFTIEITITTNIIYKTFMQGKITGKKIIGNFSTRLSNSHIM